MRLLRRLPTVVCLVYVLLAAIYSIAIPVYEPQDERYHFAFIQHLLTTGELPVQNPAIKQPWNQEGSQAPLYYVLASLVARIVPGADEPFVLAVNPHAIFGVREARSNHNLWTPGRDESFPWRGPVLAIHLIRLMGVALGAWTVYAVYRTARLALPGIPVIAVMAMAFTAFNVMFIVQSISVNNDVMVAATGATASWLIMLILQCGFTWRRVGVLAVTLALTALSKASGLSLGVVAGALLLALAAKRRITLRQAVGAALVFGGVFAVLAGWWYLRNLQLYGDLTGLKMLSQIIGFRVEPFTINALLRDSDLLRVSFWGFYGWQNVFIGPEWLPGLMDILTWIAVMAGIWQLFGAIRTKSFALAIPIGLLGLHFVVMTILVINYTWQIPASVGRLLLPAMGAISILAVYGWYVAASIIRARWLSSLPVAGLAVVAILSPFLSIGPAYATPPVVSALPADAIPLDVRFDRIKVLGYGIARTPVNPGGSVPVTLYYQGEPDERNLSLYLTALGREGRAIGKVDSYPGGGNLPTSIWNPAAIYADSYVLPITPDALGPVQLKIELGWWNFATGEHVKPARPDGTAIEDVVLRGGALLSAQADPQPTVAQQAVFSSALRLDGYTLTPSDGSVGRDGRLDLTLIWEGLTPVYEDFNVFVHLQTEDGKLCAQADSPPLRGDYPTSAWTPGRPFADPHSLQLSNVPPGTYRLVIGLYRLGDGSRLPLDVGGDSLTLRTLIAVQ